MTKRTSFHIREDNILFKVLNIHSSFMMMLLHFERIISTVTNLMHETFKAAQRNVKTPTISSVLDMGTLSLLFSIQDACFSFTHLIDTSNKNSINICSIDTCMLLSETLFHSLNNKEANWHILYECVNSMKGIIYKYTAFVDEKVG